MRHKAKQSKLGRVSSHRSALLSNLSSSLITHGRIHTTLAKAKALRPFVEKLVTKSAKNSLASRRLVLSCLKNHTVVQKLIAEIAPKYATRPGGYTRIMKNGYRPGDNAPMALIEFV